MAATRKDNESSRTRRPPATTPEARENRLVASAFDLAEKQILDGNVSAQVLTHFLKLGSEREKTERRKIQLETELLAARRDAIVSSVHMEELYGKAIRAMSEYQGRPEEDDDDEY